MNFYRGNLFSLQKKNEISRLVSISSIDSIFDYGGIIPRYFNLVVEGTGPNVVYVIGLYDVLKKLQKTGDITISKYVGSGIASIMLVCLCANMDKKTIIQFFRLMYHDITNDYWKKEFLRILPPDAYKTCSHRVYIYTSVPICRGIYFFTKQKIFSEFYSNRDLVEACCISCHKPSLIGSFGHEQQLKIWITRLNSIDRILYQRRKLYQLYQERIDQLIKKAKQDADDFFTQKLKPNTTILEWCLPSYQKTHLFYYFIPSMVIIFFLVKNKRVSKIN